jgi:hypothetical protein
VTLNTGASAIVARPDIAAGWLIREPNQIYTLQMVSGKEVFLTLTLGWRPLKIWVLVANI